jgi:hypoxanthine phosphoribosyltransferase
MADLVRSITLPMTTDFMAIASYGSGTESAGTIQLISDLRTDIEGRDVLLIEDIVDTGLSLQFLLHTLAPRHPKSLGVCALLDKPEQHRGEISIQYVGFTIPDRFVVGYGIDYNEQFRNLPYIGYVEFSR